MTLRGRALGMLAAGAVLAVVAGCGGGSGPSKAEFVKKADALCAQTNKAHPPKPAPKNAKEASAIWTEEGAIRRDLDKGLRALDVPGDAKSAFAAYNAGTAKILAAIDRMAADAKANDEKKFGVDQKVFDTEAAAREKAAIKIGFKTCGRKNPVQ
ncbi:MAG: hypothetical protein QOG41_2516 [Thermoleophilaceae bacterium]|nr:hypothetical protein [Thermoleophilaceae bacterium]